MEKEICTGSYTGEFCPKKNGPWAQHFNDDGSLIVSRPTEPMPHVPGPLDRIANALEFFQSRTATGDVAKALA